MIFFTADGHLCHENIISSCKRPFENVEHMNDTIISNWNSKVSKRDTVYCLGDLILTKRDGRYDQQTIVRMMLSRLNGHIVLIKGDHDYDSIKYFPNRFSTIHDYYYLKYNKTVEIALFHWPIARWRKSHYNSWHLHGHCHGMYDSQGKSFDIGMDNWNFYPLSIDEVINEMKNRSDNENLLKKVSKKEISQIKGLKFEQLSMDL